MFFIVPNLFTGGYKLCIFEWVFYPATSSSIPRTNKYISFSLAWRCSFIIFGLERHDFNWLFYNSWSKLIQGDLFKICSFMSSSTYVSVFYNIWLTKTCLLCCWVFSFCQITSWNTQLLYLDCMPINQGSPSILAEICSCYT